MSIEHNNNLEPTQKQIDFAERLAEQYEVDISDIPFTRADYSEFISLFKDM